MKHTLVLLAFLLGISAILFIGCSTSQSPADNSQPYVSESEQTSSASGISSEAPSDFESDEEDENKAVFDPLIETIQKAVNNENVSELYSIIDPKYPEEGFLIADFTGSMSSAMKDLVPIVSDVFENDPGFTPSEIQLSYISGKITDNEARVTYAVLNSGFEIRREEVLATKINGEWLLTGSGENAFLESAINKKAYSELPFVMDLNSVDSNNISTYSRSEKIGLCTKDDKREIMMPCFEEYYGFENGAMISRYQGKFVVIIPELSAVIDMFEDAFITDNSSYYWFQYQGKWGVINFETNEVIYPQYDKLVSCTTNNGKKYLCVSNDEKFGMVSEKNDIIIPLSYDSLGRPSLVKTGKVLMVAKKGDYYGVIDEENNVIQDFVFTYLGSYFVRDMVACSVNGAYGVIDCEGKYVIRPEVENTWAMVTDKYIVVEETVTYYPYHTGIGETRQELFLYDFSGKRITDEFHVPFENWDYHYNSDGSVLMGMECLDDIAHVRTGVMYIDDYWICGVVDKDGNFTNLFDGVYKSLESELPELTSGLTYYNFSDTGVRGITLVYCSGCFNLVDRKGNVLLDHWVELNNKFLPFVLDNYLVYPVSTFDDLFHTKNQWYMLDLNTLASYNIGEMWGIYEGYLHEDEKFESMLIYDKWDRDGNQLVYCKAFGGPGISGYSFVIDLTNKKVMTLQDFVGTDYEITGIVVELREYPIVTDGIFYGLIDKNGLVGDGMVYTEYDYEDGVYTLKRGNVNTVSYRILPDGTATTVE